MEKARISDLILEQRRKNLIKKRPWLKLVDWQMRNKLLAYCLSTALGAGLWIIHPVAFIVGWIIVFLYYLSVVKILGG
ncbi:MAG: hypothetical protein KatS3mg087_0574 [Patescibacteria group bacterium]|nr:MAG: hypothetical protein KatS3mg087_0574 [Patescibacteria group bacterium]